MKHILFLFAIFALCFMKGKFVTAQNTKDYKVIVRTYFNNTDMNLNKAGNINNRFKQRMSQYATTNTMPQTRNLRVDRQLQTWCRDYCPRYGCSWCKANDAVFGVDCSRYCRRREEEELQPHDRELQTDGMATFVSDQNKFTSQQAATCSAMLASMRLTAVETASSIATIQCFLVPQDFTLPSQ